MPRLSCELRAGRARRESPLQSETPQGTLDMLVLRVLVLGAAHGHTIAHAIERGSETCCRSSTAPCIRRCIGSRIAAGSFVLGHVRQQPQGEVLPADAHGRKQLAAQTTRWEEIVRAIGRILNPSTE